MTSRLALYWEFSRPFTLLAPALGMLSGAVTAFGAAPRSTLTGELVFDVVLGTLMASVLNAASNGINQIYDLEVDRVNKPGRPLTSGRMSIREAQVFTWTAYAVALAFAALVNWECFSLALFAAVATYVYSVPPLRTKARGLWANLTIALPRGVGLKVAGWTTVKTYAAGEPWYIGLIFGLFLLGASSTKDFADIEGDRAGGCRTLPILYGVRRAAWMIAPSFVLPFLLLPLGVWTGILTGNPLGLVLLGVGLAAWGSYVVYLILRDPDALAGPENHPSWTHMYLMMLVMQIGFAAAYLW
jgi:4-hydroxybenzoate polyprenyltransferase